MAKVGTIEPPLKSDQLPENVQWLSGQGTGIWFCIDEATSKNEYSIKRYKPSGELDCERAMTVVENGVVFDINKAYQFIHISHCSKCRILQDEIIFVFNYIKK